MSLRASHGYRQHSYCSYQAVYHPSLPRKPPLFSFGFSWCITSLHQKLTFKLHGGRLSACSSIYFRVDVNGKSHATSILCTYSMFNDATLGKGRGPIIIVLVCVLNCYLIIKDVYCRTFKSTLLSSW